MMDFIMMLYQEQKLLMMFNIKDAKITIDETKKEED